MAETSPKIGSTCQPPWQFLLPNSLSTPSSSFSFRFDLFLFLSQVWKYLKAFIMNSMWGIFIFQVSRSSIYQHIPQFWIHSELIGDIGPLGLIFNTSTYHQVTLFLFRNLSPWELNEVLRPWCQRHFCCLHFLNLRCTMGQTDIVWTRTMVDSFRWYLCMFCVFLLCINHVSQIWDRIFGTFQGLRPDEQTV